MTLHAMMGGVHCEDGRLYTASLAPGIRVYGERTLARDGKEFREWSPQRSKLAAYLSCGGRDVPISEGSNVLYLGAANGTTASHVSDMVGPGIVYCVEISPRSFRDLAKVCGDRGNMHPLLGDALRPEGYQFMVGPVDVVYQDVAQKNQVSILMDNMDTFRARYGMMAIKARSEDVTSPPERIFNESKRRAETGGFRILDLRSLEPFEKDHAMLVISR